MGGQKSSWRNVSPFGGFGGGLSIQLLYRKETERKERSRKKNFFIAAYCTLLASGILTKWFFANWIMQLEHVTWRRLHLPASRIRPKYWPEYMCSNTIRPDVFANSFIVFRYVGKYHKIDSLACCFCTLHQKKCLEIVKGRNESC